MWNMLYLFFVIKSPRYRVYNYWKEVYFNFDRKITSLLCFSSKLYVLRRKLIKYVPDICWDHFCFAQYVVSKVMEYWCRYRDRRGSGTAQLT